MRQSGILQAIYLQPTYESLRLQNRIVLAYGSNQPMLQPPNAAVMQLRDLQIILFVQVGPTLYCKPCDHEVSLSKWTLALFSIVSSTTNPIC